MIVLEIALWLLALGGALYGLHRLTLSAPPPREVPAGEYERRISTALGNALADLHGHLNPSARHVRVAKQEKRKEQDDSGDPPVTAPRGEDQRAKSVRMD